MSIEAGEVAPLAEYSVSAKFELIVLATKAQGAIDVAPSLVWPLAPGDSVSGLEPGSTTALASRLGNECVLGGLSNLVATMLRPGMYEQRNAGYLLIGEPGGAKAGEANGCASGSVVQ